MQTTVTASAGDKVTFYWKVSSGSGDYLKFYIDSQYQTQITGEVDWQKKSYPLSAGSHTLKWVYSKDSSGTAGEDRGWVDGLKVGTSSYVGQPDAMSEALDSQLKFTESGGQGWWIASGEADEYYYEADAAQSDYNLPDNGETSLQTIVDSDSAETIKVYWKVSSQANCDYLEFYIDDTRQDRISGEVDWTLKSYSVSSGIHILKWRYVKDGSGYSGDNCGWVAFVQWTGAFAGPGTGPRVFLSCPRVFLRRQERGQQAEDRSGGSPYGIPYGRNRLQAGRGRPARGKEGRWLFHPVCLRWR